ncbi:hypothetical protein HDU88_008856 [Geranomyces variabilis]|nr:hypothetical protein HDU88_008856 [Geranomyces variabilis]
MSSHSTSAEPAAPSSPLGRTPTQFLSKTQTSTGSLSDSTGHLPPSPTDLILTRCAGWLSLLRILLVQFEDQTTLEKHMAVAHTKTVRDWVSSPSHEREAAFKTSTNIQALMKNLRETSGKLASEHEAVYKVLHDQTLPALKGLEREVHHRMTGMMADEKDRRKEKDRDEQKMRALIKELKAALIAAHGTGEVAPWQVGDPWITNVAIKRHMAEAALRNQTNVTTLDGLETTFGVWEKNFIKNLKSALLAYTALTSVSASSHGATALLDEALQKLEPTHEWETYKTTQLAEVFDQNGQVATSAADDYSGATDPLVKLVKEGPLLRKTKITKHWKEMWYTLTAAGWLHEFPERPNFHPDGAPAHPQPEKSLWLKSCFISELGGQGCGSGSEFHITHINQNAKLTKGKSVFKFSSNSLSESQAWYQAISEFVPVEHGSRAGVASTSAAAAVGGAADPRRFSSASTASDTSVGDAVHRQPSAPASHNTSANPILPESQLRTDPIQEQQQQQQQQQQYGQEAPAAHTESPARQYPTPSGSTGPDESLNKAAAALPPVQPPTLGRTDTAVTAPPSDTVHPEGVAPEIPTHSPAAIAHEHETPAAADKLEHPAASPAGPIQSSAAPVEPAAPKKSGNIFKRAFGSK